MIVVRPHWPRDQAVTWDPGRVPAFQRLTAYDAFIAADLPSRRHGFSTAVNRATLAGSMTRFRHGPVIFIVRFPNCGPRATGGPTFCIGEPISVVMRSV